MFNWITEHKFPAIVSTKRFSEERAQRFANYAAISLSTRWTGNNRFYSPSVACYHMNRLGSLCTNAITGMELTYILQQPIYCLTPQLILNTFALLRIASFLLRFIHTHNCSADTTTTEAHILSFYVASPHVSGSNTFFVASTYYIRLVNYHSLL